MRNECARNLEFVGTEKQENDFTKQYEHRQLNTFLLVHPRRFLQELPLVCAQKVGQKYHKSPFHCVLTGFSLIIEILCFLFTLEKFLFYIGLHHRQKERKLVEFFLLFYKTDLTALQTSNLITPCS